MSILTVYKENKKHRILFEGTPTVQHVLESNGFSFPHPCGGTGRCGTCKIEIIGNISAPEESELESGCRLSCRTKLYGDATVVLCADTSLFAESTVENIKPLSKKAQKTGAAVDIGTTTVALSVYDLATGTLLSSKTMLNPQVSVAADVIGRISAAEEKLEKLQQGILSCIQTLVQNTGYANRIDQWCITGNTTMLYLLQGLCPKELAVSPFTAKQLFGEEIDFMGKPAYLPSCMHAFIGADVTCAVLASKLYSTPETALLCDIGTNGEIALWKNKKLYTTSTAAGPVFEGVGISCGCHSIPGAIESLRLENDNSFSVKTIENASPVGLCGSGVIDMVSCLLTNGIIDKTGAMKDASIRLFQNIFFTQEDVRNVQLAKAAIAAGIKTLLDQTGTKEEDISAFYIAGGFGTHLNLSSAVKIGLFPACLENKVTFLGNAALKGAASLLTDMPLREKAHSIARNSEHINLGGNPDFNRHYLEELNFPE